MTDHFWLIPTSIVLIIISFLVLVADNYKSLRGKDGLSKKDGWVTVYVGMKYVVLTVVYPVALSLFVTSI